MEGGFTIGGEVVACSIGRGGCEGEVDGENGGCVGRVGGGTGHGGHVWKEWGKVECRSRLGYLQFLVSFS